MQKQRTRYMESLDGKIADALGVVRRAQEELAAALVGLVPVAVGDKQLITPTLECSFQKVRVAQAQVSRLQQLLARA